jgi:hypothetical protein
MIHRKVVQTTAPEWICVGKVCDLDCGLFDEYVRQSCFPFLFGGNSRVWGEYAGFYDVVP